MKKTIVKYVGGLSKDDAKSKYKIKLHKTSFSDVRAVAGGIERIKELQNQE